MKTLKGRKVGIIGFNARPIAAAVKKLGGVTYVSDYWGDMDLAAVSDESIAVLNPVPGSRQRGSLDNPVHISLSDNFLTAFSETEFDYVLIGSGFDDHIESLKKIESQYILSGNNSMQFARARDRIAITQFVEEMGIHVPKSIECESERGVLESALQIGFPCVIRPQVSGGGSGIKVFTDLHKLQLYLEMRNSHKLIVQELVKGQDLSVSMLCTESCSKVLSLQKQLIGLPSAGRNCDFVYCGNSIPSLVGNALEKKIHKVSKALMSYLSLSGSNGIDLVIADDSTIYFMEVNPRIQGTLEMLEYAGGVSVLQYHLDALEGRLPTNIPSWQPTVKLVVYARSSGFVPELSRFPTSVDRSPFGVAVSRGDPICTLIERGPSIQEAYRAASMHAQSIQREILGTE